MSKRKAWIWAASVTGVLVLGGGTTYYVLNQQAETAGTEIVEQMPVTVQKVSERELVESILVTGEIVPENEQKVFLEAEKGTITEYKVVENQVVKAGDPLFVYDSSKIDVEYNQAVRQKSLIETRSKTEKSQIANLDKRIAETKQKVATPDSGVTQADVDALANEKVQLEIQYESTKAEIASASEQIAEIAARKNDMTVVSKMDGIVVKVNQNLAISETGSTEPVVHIISNLPYKVIGTMSEFDAVKIKQQQPVIIRPKVFKDREWNGVVESVSQFPNEDGASADPYAGGAGGNVTMYPFKVAITDDTSELRQGFHVSLEIKVVLNDGAKKPAIPHSALLNEGGVDVAYVLVDGKLSRREVQTGAMSDEWIEVASGLELGEQVVITPYEGMQDGMEVTSYDEVE